MPQKQIGNHQITEVAEMSFPEALAVLRQATVPPPEKANGTIGSEPVEVPLNDIAMLPNVFQLRVDEAAEDERAQQIDRLVKALETKPVEERSLDPILAGKFDGVWVCLDGHHRLQAYAKVGVATVPVVAFAGTADDALLAAGAVNGKTKLPLTPRDRQEAAWRLTASTSHSIKEVAEATGVSKRQVSNMRTVRKELEALGEQPADHGWISAKMIAEGEQPGERGEDWEEKQIIRFEKGLRKIFGKHVHRNREFMAAALENNYRSLVATIIERNAVELREMIEEILAEHDEYEDHDDF